MGVSPVSRPWTLAADAVLEAFGTHPSEGLTSEEAARRLARYGPNQLEERGRRPPWLLFLQQFTSAMILVLVVAAVISAIVGDLKDTVVIMAVVTLNGIVAFVQEYRAERAMAALKQMTSPTARVVRDGQVRVVSGPEVVPGDLVQLAAGDLVVADLRLTEVRALRVNEAPLTGESEPVAKTTDPLPEVTAQLVGERRNMAFQGTAVTYGRGTGVVIATGMGTELGRIAELMQAHQAGKTPLQQRLTRLATWIATAAFVVCAAVFLAGLASGVSVELMFLTAVSLLVAAVPEGMPVVVTVALALGAHRMVARRALIRKLPAVETLGSVSVICTDKTGTLTENRMTVQLVWTPGAEYRVSGDGYAPVGSLEGSLDPEADPHLGRLAAVAAACNDASLHPPTTPGGEWTFVGDPTEAALLAFAGKRGVFKEELSTASPRVAELAFDAARRRMTTLHEDGGSVWVATKGALEALAPLLDPADGGVVAAAREAEARYGSEGYRVLALAERRVPEVPATLEAVESGLRLLGLVALADPPRPESAPAIRECQAAGITPVMITGDDARTAETIARRVGILDGEGEILTGADLDSLDDDAFAERVASIRVYARTNPEQKLRIVEAWKRQGAIVAMTGDGVNDAPALRRADIGVAMGITGTEVSKEAADMVLVDDNFATIVHAVEEGRRIYDNIRRFVRFVLATHSGQIWLFPFALLLGLPIPLLPVQILWINIVTDGLPSIALGVEPVEPTAMRRPPRPPGESILAGGLWQHAVWVGLLMAVVGIALQWGAMAADWPWQTMLFTAFALLQLVNAVSVRSERESLFAIGFRSNPWLALAVGVAAAIQIAIVYVPLLQGVFETEALTPLQLAVVLAVSTTVFWAVEVEKWLRRRRERARAPATG